jgi:regulator of sigma E protease
MSVLGNVFWMGVVLAVIIFVHESGHFWAAKAFGMRVFVFSFGFGPRLFGVRYGDTDYRLSGIPLGGYVKLEGEPEDAFSAAVEEGTGKTYAESPRWQRFLMYLAGPLMNAVLTFVAFVILYMLGFGFAGELYDRPVVGFVEEQSPAARAGIQPGDEILSINGDKEPTWEDALSAILVRPDTALHVRFARGGQEQEALVQSRSTAQKVGDIGVYPLVRVGRLVEGDPAVKAGVKEDDGILGIDGIPVRAFEDIPPILKKANGGAVHMHLYRGGATVDLAVTPKEDGHIGIGPKVVFKKLGPIGASQEAFRATIHLSAQTVTLLSDLIRGRVAAKAALQGPVGIAQAAGQAAKSGMRDVLYLIAVLSVSVGLLNLFPLAPLDGGHMAILVGEGVIRRDFSLAVKMWVMNAGAVVLFLLIGLVLYSDLSKTSLLGHYLH